MNCQVELTGRERDYAVTDDKGNEFSAHQMYNANNDWTEWEVYDSEGDLVKGKVADQIIEACSNIELKDDKK